MEVVYHGSKTKRLTRLNPRKSTHGEYVYATPDKALALNFSSRCGDDLTYGIGHFDTEKEGPWELVELIPLAFDKMYSNSSSIYTLPGDTFKDIHTGFCEVVSTTPVDVITEEHVASVYDGLIALEKEGKLKIYRYPSKPKNYKPDGLDIIDKWRYYKNVLHKEFNKYDFDRLIFLHPELLEEANKLLKEFNYEYQYEPIDLIDIFRKRIERQIAYPEHEQYIDSAFISICHIYKELKEPLEELYLNYKSNQVSTEEYKAL